MSFKTINEKTPNGGDYSEIHFLDDKNNEVEENATHCVIRECMNDGSVIKETWAKF